MLQTRVNPINQIIREITNFISKWGGTYPQWYVGVASNPRDRLFNDHNVDKDRDAWIYRDCGSDTAAREVERYFLDRGCQGGAGGGDDTTKYCYAYKINNHTVE